MSKADQMFSRLGFTKNGNSYFKKIIYNITEIKFDLEHRFYVIYKSQNVPSMAISGMVSTELHQAIHEKLKELGWLNEKIT